MGPSITAGASVRSCDMLAVTSAVSRLGRGPARAAVAALAAPREHASRPGRCGPAYVPEYMINAIDASISRRSSAGARGCDAVAGTQQSTGPPGPDATSARLQLRVTAQLKIT
jgi:hypothetical protein